MFTNPLDNIRVASPCPANWDEMFGDERKRFCSDCKLNVYNLSGMTRSEAENLILDHEGRLCVRFFRRADGTVLTTDCPVGWAAIKRRVSRVATAAASVLFGLATGLIGIRAAETLSSMFSIEPVQVVPIEGTPESKEIQQAVVGEAVPEQDLIQGEAVYTTVGQIAVHGRFKISPVSPFSKKRLSSRHNQRRNP